MKETNEPSRQLNEIHEMMQRSSRFISLSGLSGISAGITAIFGAAVAYFFLNYGEHYVSVSSTLGVKPGAIFTGSELAVVLDGIVVLVLALAVSIYFTTRRAKRKNLKAWDNTARRLLINLLIPLVAGGIYCLVLFYYRFLFLIPSATLVFYGLALIHASKYTYHEIRIMGITETLLGLVAAFLPEYNLIFWAAGFGLVHIIYGSLMYSRYEKIKST